MIRVAVFGCGSIGRRHIRNLVATGKVGLIAFDVAAAHMQDFAREAGIRVTSDAREVWDFSPEVAVIALPTHLHLEWAMVAASKGCHLFIEKPLSHTLEGLDSLAAEVRSQRLISMVGCNMRFHPGPATVKRLLEAGSIGQVLSARIHAGSYLPGWRSHLDYRNSYSAIAEQGGGVFLDCIHEIDLALWYLGCAELVAAAANPATSLGLQVDGLAEILLRHRTGALSSVHLNFVQRDYRRCCQVFGTDGSLYWDFSEPIVREWRNDKDEELHRLPEGWQLNAMFEDEIHCFLDCVDNRRPCVNDIESAAETTRIALLARHHACAWMNDGSALKQEAMRK